MVRSWRTAIALLSPLLLAGCASTGPQCGCLVNPDHPGCQEREAWQAPQVEYVLAEARYGAAVGEPRQVEINKTETYEKNREDLRAAAVRPPDNCVSESAGEVQGESSSSAQIAATDCGVWVSEIEKSLVRSGFRVVSWDALRAIEQNEKVPPYKAAKKLGAGVLFLFNSLELASVEAGGKSAYRIEYFNSSSQGKKGNPLPMTEGERGTLRSAVIERIQTGVDGDARVLSSTVDATAILTDNGEAIWFYRNTALERMAGQAGRAFLFARYQSEPQWYFADPTTTRAPAGQVVAAPPEKSAVDTGGTTVSATRDQARVAQLELVRTVTNDFVESFRTGEEVSTQAKADATEEVPQ